MKRAPKKTQKKKKKGFPPQLLLLVIALFIVIVSSLLINSDIFTLFSRASEPFDYSPTMKQKKLNFNVDPSGSEPQDTPVPNTPKPGQTSSPNATATPKPVPTSAASTYCKLDNLMNPPNCKCPDLQGLKCVGEATNGIQNYYYLVPGNFHGPSDTEGQYVGVKGAYLFRYTATDYAKKKVQFNCTEWCIGKPVIYLYPTEPTYTDVQVVVPGRVFVSDPLYPVDGWKNVLAHPDGRLDYQGKTYKELYYETALDTDLKKPENGLFIERSQLSAKLLQYTRQLGLNGKESTEFIEYWVPHLEELNSKYILFSILEDTEKERIDTVVISPKPETFIGFIAYFKAVDTPYQLPELELPVRPPERVGFTAVEWGGTIDNGGIQ
jgi:hypothetical protein